MFENKPGFAVPGRVMDGLGLYHISWSTISCTQFQISQFPIVVTSKNGPFYLCVNYELSPSAYFYCCSRKWLLLFVLSSLLELITEYLRTLSDTPVNAVHQIFPFLRIFQKFRLSFWPFSGISCSISFAKKKKKEKCFFLLALLKSPLLLFKTGSAANTHGCWTTWCEILQS